MKKVFLKRLISSMIATLMFMQLLLVQNIAFANTNFEIDKNRESKTITGLEGRYFKNEEFSELAIIKNSENGRLNIGELNSNEQIKSVSWQGYLEPKYSEEYIFSTSNNISTRLLIDGNLLMDYENKNSNKIKLEKGIPYKIEIEYKKLSSNENLDLIWESNSQQKEIIPKERLFLPKYKDTKRKKRSSSSTSFKSTDTDKDSIPDKWEREGYTFYKGELVKWDDNIHKNTTAKKYITNPYKYSTDKDPYSDFEEVTGFRMDDEVKSPGNHPLVAAYPNIKVILDSMDVTPTDTLTLSNGENISSSISNSVSNTDGVTTTHGTAVGSSYSVKLKAGTNGIESEHTVTVSGEYNFSKAENKSSTVSKSTSEGKNVSWNKATSKTPAKAANVKLNVRYKNVGTAPAFEVEPTLSLVKNQDSTVFTTKVPEAAKASEISPMDTYPNSNNGNIAIQYRKDDRTPLTLTIDELNMIQSGKTFDLTSPNTDSKIRLINEKGTPFLSGKWSTYTGLIDSSTADIYFSTPNKDMKEFKVYAKQFPEVTLKDALEITLGLRVDSNGDILIGNKKVDKNWSVSFSPETANKVNRQLELDNNLLKIKLDPDMKILIRQADLNKKPIIKKAVYSSDKKHVEAVVLPSDFSIKDVKAKVKINGKEEYIKLDQDSEKSYIYKNKTSIEGLDINYTGEIIAKDRNNKETRSEVFAIGSLTKVNGLTFIKDRRHINNNNLKQVVDELTQKGAESFIFKLNTQQNLDSKSQHYKFNNSKYYTGLIDKSKSGKPILGDLFIDHLGNWFDPHSIGSGTRRAKGDWDDYVFLGYYDYNDYGGDWFGYKRHVAYYRHIYTKKSFKDYRTNWDNCITSIYEYYDSLKKHNRGIVLFDGYNYDGDAFGTTKGLSNLGESNFKTGSSDVTPVISSFDNKASSFQIVDKFEPLAKPSHNYTLVLSKEDLENINEIEKIMGLENDIKISKFKGEEGLYLEGYYAKDDENGSKFTPMIKKIDQIEINKKSDTAHITWVPDATGYLAKITAHNVSSDNIDFIFNQGTNNKTKVSMGTSDSSGLGYKMGAYYPPTHSEIVYIPVSEDSKGKIKVDIKASDLTQWYGKNSESVEWFKKDENKSKYTIELLGYYSKNGEQYYQNIDPIPFRSLSTNQKNKKYIDINESVYKERIAQNPKGYMVKVDARNAGSSKLRININGQSADLGTSASKDHNGIEPIGIDHTTLMYVPIKSKSDPYGFDITTQHNSKFIKHGIYDIQIIGYYY